MILISLDEELKHFRYITPPFGFQKKKVLRKNGRNIPLNFGKFFFPLKIVFMFNV